MDKISDGTAINIGMGRLTTFRDIINVFANLLDINPLLRLYLINP